MKKRIHFPQFNKSKVIEPGKTVLDYARELGVPINIGYGRLGIRKECRIKVEGGSEALNKRTKAEEELDKEERLASHAVTKNVEHDVYVSFVQSGFITNILTHASKTKEFFLNSSIQKKGNKVFSGEKEIDNYRNGIFGIATDIGTTTVVLHLMDLEKGSVIHTSAFENPQKRIDGGNVISRILFDGKSPGKLHTILITKINEEIKKMPVDSREIYDFVIVGNSTMRDLFFGLDVQSLGVSPYRSVTEKDKGGTFLRIKAPELNLRLNKNAEVYGPPLIGSHIGSDALAVSLSCGIFDESGEIAMCIDIGTNGEIVLQYGEGIIATSCAAGPALEPMPALPGAIDRFRIKGGKISWQTIGDIEPIGICGSGIIDIMGELRKNNMMDEDGYLKNGKVFKITDNIQITQPDIKGTRGFLFGKAAISLGIKALLEEKNLSTDELDKVYIAGSFGTYIDKENARIIGLVPDIPSEKIIQVGNAAALGAQEILLSSEMKKTAENTVNKIEHIGLELLPNYGERLMLIEQKFGRLRVLNLS